MEWGMGGLVIAAVVFLVWTGIRNGSFRNQR
jgi:hypothetical protein